VYDDNVCHGCSSEANHKQLHLTRHTNTNTIETYTDILAAADTADNDDDDDVT